MKRSVAKIWGSQWEIMYNVSFQDLCIKTSWIHTNYEITKACSFSPLTHKPVLYFRNEYQIEPEVAATQTLSILRTWLVYQLQRFCISNVVIPLSSDMKVRKLSNL